jgi:hypothetical protein
MASHSAKTWKRRFEVSPLMSTKSHIVRTPGYSWLYHNFANI